MRCPDCHTSLREALTRGDEYCPVCGFEFGRCWVCHADVREVVRSGAQECPACGRGLGRRVHQRLPDEAFWNSRLGSYLKAAIFIAVLLVGIGFALGALSFWHGRR